jgi:hypothetical protein
MTATEAIEQARTTKRAQAKAELRAILTRAAQVPMPQGDATRAAELCDTLGVTSAAAGAFIQAVADEKALGAAVAASDAPARLAKAEAELAKLEADQSAEELVIVKRLDDPSNQSKRRVEQGAIVERYSARIAEARNAVTAARQARDEHAKLGERLAVVRRAIAGW